MDKTKIKKKIFSAIRKVGRIFYGKNVWLISDRQFHAGDNGEAFFKYVQDKEITSIFAIAKSSDDYDRIRKIGKTVEHSSILYKFLLCVCDAHISSQLLHMENHEETYQIFLQHGVAATDISVMLNPVSHSNFFIITSGKAEYESMRGGNYTINPEHVWLTGLPRHDYLYNNPQKVITVLFTWRKYLTNASVEEFKESSYFKAFEKLVTDDAMKSRLEQMGYKLCFRPHPEMQHFMEVFEENRAIGIWEKGYTDIFAESDLIITDYSSVVFDFAQLQKPVIYYQFDSEEFWKAEKNYTKGYFDYETDGFGEVVYSQEELAAVVLDYCQNNCVVKDGYRARVDKFFGYQDKNNSERVYTKIMELITEKQTD